jgi:preprotein translocase subunit Sss1
MLTLTFDEALESGTRVCINARTPHHDEFEQNLVTIMNQTFTRN